MKGKIIEICLESATSVLRAEEGGAGRVELCSDLFEGGLTPSLGTFRTARKLSSLPVSVMVRPRGGDFCYSDDEFAVMMEDVKVFKEEGAESVVFGILTPDGDVDYERCRLLRELSYPMEATFHRAFDMTRDPFASLETIIELGFNRILTSGQEATVYEGADLICELVKAAGDRIIVMPGCGITERNFSKIDRKIGAKEYHVYLPGEKTSAMTYHPGHIYMGGMLRQSEFLLFETDSSRVRNIVEMSGEGRG